MEHPEKVSCGLVDIVAFQSRYTGRTLSILEEPLDCIILIPVLARSWVIAVVPLSKNEQLRDANRLEVFSGFV